MSSRKLDQLATDIDEASITVEELQSDPDTDIDEKLDDLHTILEKASDAIDDFENDDQVFHRDSTPGKPAGD